MNYREVLRGLISRQLKVEPDQLETDRDLAEYGLNSVQAVTLSGLLEDELGMSFDPALLFEFPTLDALAQYLESAREGS